MWIIDLSHLFRSAPACCSGLHTRPLAGRVPAGGKLLRPLCQLDIAREYYIEKKTESLKKKNWATKAVKVSTIVSGVMFFIGLVCTLCFCEVNMH